MALILHSGLDEFITVLEKEAVKIRATLQSFSSVNDAEIKVADLILLGPAISDPVQLLQKISSADKNLSILVVCRDKELEELRQKIMFTPLLSKNIFLTIKKDLTATLLQENLNQTRLRRKFSKLQVKPPASVASSFASPSNLEQLGFLNQAPIAAILFDKNLNVLAMNKSARILFDLVYSAEEQNELSSFMSENAIQNLKKIIEEKEDGAMLELDTVSLEVSVSEVVNRENERFDLVLLNDVTERRQQDERIRNILDSLPQMAWIATAGGKLTYLSSRWYAYTGQTFESAKGLGWLEALHDEDKYKVADLWRRSVKTGIAFEIEGRFRSAAGQFRWHLLRGLAVKKKTGKVDYWVGTATDIDDQKLLEQRLEARVKERTEQLYRLNKKLQASYLELEQFAYITTHDLQEPIRKIITFGNMLSEQARDRLNADDVNLLNRIMRSSKRLRMQIIDVLTYTKLLRSVKPSSFKPVNLSVVLKKVIEEHKNTIKEKDAEIKYESLPVITAVEKQLQQLFSALLSNSLKFIESGKKPVIEISVTPVHPSEIASHLLSPDTEYIKIIYKDNGIGIDPKYSDYIFNLFRRLHSQEEYPGTGIGLALCKKIVENHKGKIFAEGSVGKGTVFTLYFPLKPESISIT